MDDIDLKIAAMEKDLTDLRTRIRAFAERLGNGGNAVRAELNPAIRRERALNSELHDLKLSSGRWTSDDLMSARVMYGPPAAARKQRFAQQDDPTGRPGNIRKVFGMWRRLIGRK